MSSNRDWMRGGEIERPTRQGLSFGGLVAWTLGLVVVADLALALMRLAG